MANANLVPPIQAPLFLDGGIINPIWHVFFEKLAKVSSTSSNAAVVLSNIAPKINGSVSAGTSSEASRADHIHPTDTTRASKSDVDALSRRISGISASTSHPNLTNRDLAGSHPASAISLTSSNWTDVQTAIDELEEGVRYIEFGDTFATNMPFRLVNGIATVVTSSDVAVPFVDGITLESGDLGHVGKVAMIMGLEYPTLVSLPAYDTLFLSSTGTLTGVKPTSGWLYSIVRRIEDKLFVFQPSMPLKLA